MEYPLSGPGVNGCSQGSILGPLLFVISVNNLPNAVEECTTNLYADDMNIYSADADPVVRR